MDRFRGKCLGGYGLFLIVIGVPGFLSNPEKAKTALLSGGAFGLLSITWGILLHCGVRWAWGAAAVTTLLLTAVFVWRASAGWMAVAEGRSEKQTAAILITLMLLASIPMGALLLWPRHRNAMDKT
jgi:uncharacterized membrane protein (UPF0136 family)